MNYRSDVHSFLALDEFFDGEYGNGKRAHLEQIAAIEWIKENAGAFGCDPENITSFWQPAGAVSVMRKNIRAPQLERCKFGIFMIASFLIKIFHRYFCQ